jgi:hypothetical protein
MDERPDVYRETLPISPPILGKSVISGSLVMRSVISPHRLTSLTPPLADAPADVGLLPLSSSREPEPLSSYHELAPSLLLPLLPHGTFKLINGYGHKSFKLEDVSSLKEMSTHWNGTGVVSPTPMYTDNPDSWSTTPNQRDLVRHGQVYPWFI